MLKVGFVGWRGMVGSVLLDRMRQEGDFGGIEARFYSTSNVGGSGPAEAGGAPLLDAMDPGALAACDVLISCQGGDYTKAVLPKLEAEGFRGIWIDASSALRMDERATLVLDPVNGADLRDALHRGSTLFAGANCTISLLILALLGLLRRNEVEWISTMTYQAASGAGAKQMLELVEQMRFLSAAASGAGTALEVDAALTEAFHRAPVAALGAPLAASLLPWIDTAMPSGQTREEWKAEVEATRLLGSRIPIDGTCVRVGSMRCHAQALTIKLKREIPLDEIEGWLADAHDWTSVVRNDKAETFAKLTPAAVGGTLLVPIGRLRPMTLGPTFLTGFTVGDQLLWGAAEPLRRMLGIVREVRGL